MGCNILRQGTGCSKISFYTFVLLISWPPKHLEVPFCTVFNGLLLCRFQNYQICYDLVKFFMRYGKNSKRKSLEKLDFLYNWIKNLNTQDHTGILRSTQKHQWALLSIHKYGVKVLEAPWVPWRLPHECLLAIMRAVGAMTPWSWVLMAASEYSRVPMSAH